MYDTTWGPLPISDVYYIKPMLVPHEGWPMAVGNCSRPRGSAPYREKPDRGPTNTRTRRVGGFSAAGSVLVRNIPVKYSTIVLPAGIIYI